MKLVIGNKNYSSWSMRPWYLMKHFGIAFEEQFLSFNDPDFKQKLARLSPSRRVPLLIDDGLTVWDSLAICEYLAEKFPDKSLWPQAAPARAHARSLCAEMHSGFTALRGRMPMNLTASLPGLGWNLEVQADIERIAAAWQECLTRYGGPFLFGAFSIADAYFAPVVSRFVTYQVQLPAAAASYVRHIWGLPTSQDWLAQARAENEFVAFDEPYRRNA